MRLIKSLAFVLLSALVCEATAERAQAQPAPPECRELPPIAWDSPEAVAISEWVGPVHLAGEVPRIAGAKTLYLQALCGGRPREVWRVVDRGKGRVFELDDALAASLDALVPHLPRVDYLYVRGGGREREAVVILFTNGHRGPMLQVDPVAWTRHATDYAARHWDHLPYEFLRVAASWLHHVGRFEGYITVKPLDVYLGPIKIFTTPESRLPSPNRGLASPLGAVLASRYDAPDRPDDDRTGSTFWIHELAHFNDYGLYGFESFLWTNEFTGITRRNGTVAELVDAFGLEGFGWDVLKALAGGIRLPYFMVENDPGRFELQQDACPRRWLEGVTTKTPDPPPAYATAYGFCGESSGEDLGDTLSIAVGLTQGIQRRLQRELEEELEGRERLFRTAYAPDSTTEWMAPYDPARLYGKRPPSERWVAKLRQKAEWARELYTYSPTAPMDADGDGVPWVLGEEPCNGHNDCDDTNPVIGTELPDERCHDDSDCDDGDECTVDTCIDGTCTHEPRDRDGDGFADAACGGEDCDDGTSSVHPGADELCNHRDDDCDGHVDEDAVDARTFYRDHDGDGYGVEPVVRCETGDGLAEYDGDCDDDDPRYHPGAPETECTDPNDYNCDGEVGFADADGDGVAACEDCNDRDPTVFPGAEEACNGMDDDCDGRIDEEVGAPTGEECETGRPGACAAGATRCVGGELRCAPLTFGSPERCNGEDDDCDGLVDEGVTAIYFRDADGDGYGDPGEPLRSCETSAPAGYVDNRGDCYDRNARVHPGQTDLFSSHRGDGSFDYDCDGGALPEYASEFEWDSWWVGCGPKSIGWMEGLPSCGEQAPFADNAWRCGFHCCNNENQRIQRCR